LVNTPYAWHWEATYPQVYGYTDDPRQAEQVNVSVAQNLRVSDGRAVNMSSGTARGRSFHDGKLDRTPGAVARGFNFQEQWKRAEELAAPFVMVTGWNEWIAGRFGKPGGPIVFVDQFNQQFSRDIEPMVAGHGDNYYWQLVANVRRYKGAPPLPAASPATAIAVGRGFAQWRHVAPAYGDHVGETAPRDFDGVAGLHYTNRSGRNDLMTLKVARDAQHVYFYAQTRETMTPSTGPGWMWLLIDADENPRTGWEGFDYIVNRTVESGRLTWLEKNAGGWKWTRVAAVPYQVEGKQLQLALPRAAIGLPAGATAVAIDFKWADHLRRPGTIADFYLSGDVAPEGRFVFRYVGQ